MKTDTDKHLRELVILWELAIDDNSNQANYLYQRLLALGATQTEEGKWVLGEENV